MREISLTQEVGPLPLVWPIALCLSRECLQSLIDFHHSKYRKRLAIEDWVNPPDIMAFDGAVVMSQTPRPSRAAMR